MGVNDVGEFSSVCKNAALNDEVVVILRFAFSNYSCSPLYDIREYVGLEQNRLDGYAIEKWIYQNVDLCHIVFAKNDQSYVLPVASAAIDCYGGLTIFDTSGSGNVGDNGGGPDWWHKILEILTVVLIVLGFIALFPLIILLVSFLIRFIGGSAKASTRVAKKEIERSKQKKNKNKKE